jgi:hypothetical protein
MPSPPRGDSILLREFHRSLPSVVKPVLFELAKVAFSCRYQHQRPAQSLLVCPYPLPLEPNLVIKSMR